jgi:hypothetical protein
MPDYDRQFSPPAPVLLATLRTPQTGAEWPDVKLFIDTGADITLLPATGADAIGVERSGRRYELEAYDGTKSSAEAVYAELSFLGRTFLGRFLLVDDEIGILGRDVLNSLALVLDGPRLTWEEHVPARDA